MSLECDETVISDSFTGPASILVTGDVDGGCKIKQSAWCLIMSHRKLLFHLLLMSRSKVRSYDHKTSELTSRLE